MTPDTSVRVNYDLSAGKPCVALRSAGNKPSGRIYMVRNIFLIQQMWRDNVFNNLFYHILTYLFQRNIRTMLCRDNYCWDPKRLTINIFYSNLGFSIRSQIWEDVFFPHICQPACELVSKHDRHWHTLFCLISGITEHKTLVTGASCINSHWYIRRLRMDWCHNSACFEVKSIFRPGIAHFFYCLSYYIRYLHVCVRGDLPCYEGKPGSDQSLTCNPAHRVIYNNCI
jgi:hypothetical protein